MSRPLGAAMRGHNASVKDADSGQEGAEKHCEPGMRLCQHAAACVEPLINCGGSDIRFGGKQDLVQQWQHKVR